MLLISLTFGALSEVRTRVAARENVNVVVVCVFTNDLVLFASAEALAIVCAITVNIPRDAKSAEFAALD